jgi:predicted MPP superfamily phosphohydrolase
LGFDLQLSGHMHAGQFFPITWLLRALYPYVAGLYFIGGLRLYVNRGAGYWGPPLRQGASKEIALIELVDQSA